MVVFGMMQHQGAASDRCGVLARYLTAIAKVVEPEVVEKLPDAADQEIRKDAQQLYKDNAGRSGLQQDR